MRNLGLAETLKGYAPDGSNRYLTDFSSLVRYTGYPVGSSSFPSLLCTIIGAEMMLHPWKWVA